MRRWRNAEFAVVLLDVRMQSIDGFETARRMRDRDDTRATPIIFLTAYDVDRSDLEHGYSLGAVDFLSKPLIPAIVRAKVTAFVHIFEEKRKSLLQAERSRLMVEGTKDYAIFMLDPTGHIASWKAGRERIKGYAAEEIIGQHFSRFYPQEAIERGWPEEELRRAAKRWPARGRGLADSQGRLPVLGQRRHHRSAGRDGQAARLRQGHTRHDGAEAG